MKKMFFLCFFLLIISANLFALYEIGDTVVDINFQETTWVNGQAQYADKSLKDLISNGKVVIIYFFDITHQ